MAARSLIGWDISDFYETAERNLTKVDRKQELNILYKVVLLARSENQDGPWLLVNIGWDIFYFSAIAEENSIKRDKKQELNVLCKVCVFQADPKKKKPEKKNELPWPLIGTFVISLQSLNEIQRYLRNKSSTSSSKFVFQTNWKTKMGFKASKFYKMTTLDTDSIFLSEYVLPMPEYYWRPGCPTGINLTRSNTSSVMLKARNVKGTFRKTIIILIIKITKRGATVTECATFLL